MGLMLHKKKLNYENKVHIAKDIVEHGLPAKYVAKLYGISVKWAQIIAKEYREMGQVSQPKKRGRKKPWIRYERTHSYQRYIWTGITMSKLTCGFVLWRMVQAVKFSL